MRNGVASPGRLAQHKRAFERALDAARSLFSYRADQPRPGGEPNARVLPRDPGRAEAKPRSRRRAVELFGARENQIG